MIRTCTVLVALLLATIAADAATYRWTDEQGTVHYTEDLGRVPEKLRGGAKVDEAEPANGEKAAPKEAPAPAALPQSTLSGGSGDGLYAGRTQAEWQKDISGREAEMTGVRSRIDEIASLLKDYKGEWEEQKKLLMEYDVLGKKLKTMRADYFRQVETARKAGLTVNIQE